MAKVTGTIIQSYNGGKAQVPVQFRYLSTPFIASGQGVYSGRNRVVYTNVLGEFEADALAEGNYEMLVGGVDKYNIAVPSGSASYDFVNILIAGAVVTPTLIDGSEMPVGSDTVVGGVRVDTNVANPIAVTGLFFVADVTELMTKGYGANNKLAWLTAPGAGEADFYQWSPASTDSHTGTDVVNPTGNPGAGRWVPR